jgi:ribosomal protein S18 acetylase RimI-like enzyme
MKNNKKRKSNPFIVGRYLLFSLLMFILALTVSVFARIALTAENMLFSYTDAQATVIAAMVQGSVAAVAAGFILYQMKISREVEKRQYNIVEAEFILHYNQALIQDKNMCHVEHLLELWMEDWNSGIPEDSIKLDINENNRQLFINYLVYLEGLAPLYFNEVLHFENIDDLFSYRFFLAINNPALQKDQLFRYPDYFRGCFRLYNEWKIYRKNKNLPILLNEFALDKWLDYEEHIDCDVSINTLTENDLKTNYKSIADLIYETDPYIYPSAFGSKRNARNVILKLLSNSTGLFCRENIRVAKINGKIVGCVVFSYNSFNIDIEKINDKNLPVSFYDVNEKYFKKLIDLFNEQGDIVYIACICVNKQNRNQRQRISDMLIKRVIKESGNKNIFLHVLAENLGAIKLFEKYGFVINGKAEEGYSYEGIKPQCYTMVKLKSM